MTETTCPNCHTETAIGANVTNVAAKYYCWNCDEPFDPATWPCPSCEAADPVNRNPLDDPAEYYCYDCELAFDRPGPSFDPADLEYDSLEDGFEAAGKRLSLDVAPATVAPPHVLECTLRNAGAEPVVVEGRLPIAVQKRVADDEWWTIHGNPKGFTPTGRVKLRPGETLEWEVLVSRHELRGPGFGIRRRFTGGEYRIVYWGIPAATTAVAVRRQIDL